MLIGNEISLFPSALARIPWEKKSDERVHLLSKLRKICKELTEERLSEAKSWKKFGIYGLTPLDSALISKSRQTRDSFNWECVLRTFGTANWKLNFVPASAKATVGKPSAGEGESGRRN